MKALLTDKNPSGRLARAVIDRLIAFLTDLSPRHREQHNKFQRWQAGSAVTEAFLQAAPQDQAKVLALDSNAYAVGMANAATREAWLEKVLGELPGGSRLLDAGAGESQFKKFCGHLRYVSQDIAQYTGEGNSVGLQTGKWDTAAIDIVCDITAIPEPAGSFDAILCTEVLEHLTDPVPALRELGRLLKVGGILIVTSPFCSLTHFAPYHYATGFNRYFYEHHLPEFGFEITDMVENGNFFEFMGQEVRRIEEMSRRYGPGEPTAIERYAMQIVLGMLQRMSIADRGSQEMLHFDYQVRATKVRNP